MKLNVDLSALLSQPERMGSTVVRDSTISIKLLPLETTGEYLTSEGPKNLGGLLSDGKFQVVLYIQDHSFNFEEAVTYPKKARRLHVAECKTIKQQRRYGRFEKYVMSNNPTGKFYITNGEGTGEYVKLLVCMNCLEMLNYQGYQQKNWPARYSIVDNFHAEEFFEKYSSFFNAFPRRQAGAKEGYTVDWSAISRQMRERADFRCSECHVDLSDYPHLLHTHHINGVKHDNSESNLQVLCIDCHSKAPNHHRMHVPRRDRLTIARLRREQTQVSLGSGWDEIARYADPAVEGLIAQCRASGVPAPDECGADIVDDKGEVVANLELAWNKSKFGVAISSDDRNAATSLGWRVGGVNDTIEHIENLRREIF